MVCDCQCDSGGRGTKCFATGPVTELSDGVRRKNRKHMFEESSVALLWQVKPQPHVCQRCISKNWLGTGFSRVNQLQVINPPLISAQQVVNWLLLLIHGYFVIWRFFSGAIYGPPLVHISDARGECLQLLIRQWRDCGSSVCPSVCPELS